MIEIKKLAVAAALMAIVAAVSGTATTSAYAVEGKRIFNKCKACHSFDKNKVGPHLGGVVGRKAGSLSDFKYSKAMEEAGAGGLVWTEENLDKFLTKPRDFVKKTKMSFAGLKKESQRKAVIEYLKEHK